MVFGESCFGISGCGDQGFSIVMVWIPWSPVKSDVFMFGSFT